MYGGMPFFGFQQGGDNEDDHFDDDHDHEEEEQQQNTDTTGLYTLLGVDKNATPDEIKKAYKKLAIQLHPDKGGDEAKFKEVTEAANILMDEKKREVYDKYGMKGIQAGLDKKGGGDDIFSMFFGNQQQQQQQEQRIAPIKIKIPVSLESLYLGRTIKLEIDRKRTCADCSGSGSSVPNAQTECDECHGQGIKVSIQRVGPGFHQQVRSHCPKCAGTGNYIPEGEKCQKCLGKTIATEKHELNIVIEKGMRDGEEILFPGEGHLVPGIKAGDVVVFLSCQEHEKFQRKFNDLKTQVKISLVEAMSSQKLYLNHLDGRILCIERPANCIISPGEVMVVHGEGMPKKENPFFKGDLYLVFSVEFPKTLPPAVQQALIEHLSHFCESNVTDLEKAKAARKTKKEEKKTEEEEQKQEESEQQHPDGLYDCSMEQGELTRFGKKPNSQTEAYHDDEEGHEGDEAGPRVGCQQM